MSAAITLKNIKHRFKPLATNAAICQECDGAFDDPLHSAQPTLNYPLTYNSVHLNGPTLFYIDQEGVPIQLGLTDKQVQAIIDDWNAEPGDSTSHTLKPPRT